MYRMYIVFVLCAVHMSVSAARKLAENPFTSKAHLLIGEHIIYTQTGRSLNEKELLVYLNMVRQGGLSNDIEGETDSVVITTGSQLMKSISYSHFEQFVVYLMKQSSALRDDEKVILAPPQDSAHKYFYKNKMIRYLLDGRFELRTPVVKTFLGGLLNLDPRVRLLAVALLRDLVVPEDFWSFINRRIEEQSTTTNSENYKTQVSFIHETVQKASYHYYSLDGKKLNDQGIIYLEILKLRRFLSRFLLLGIIQKDENLIKNMPIEVFELLMQDIDGESYCNIPLNHFNNEAEIVALIAGLENKHSLVRDRVALSLVRLIRSKDFDKDIKLHIFKILLENQDYKGFLIQGWSLEEASQLSDNELLNIMKRYIEQSGVIASCVQTYNDQYDTRNGIVDRPFVKSTPWGKPVVKDQDKKHTASELLQADSMQISKVNTIYVFG